MLTWRVFAETLTYFPVQKPSTVHRLNVLANTCYSPYLKFDIEHCSYWIQTLTSFDLFPPVGFK